MVGLDVLVAAASLVVPVGENESLFPFDASDFRFQAIVRSRDEKDWPFAAEEGYLVCAFGLGQRYTYFLETGGMAKNVSRALAISTDPFQLGFENWGQASRFAPHSGLEDLLRRVAPYVLEAQRLCDQPRGTRLDSGEL